MEDLSCLSFVASLFSSLAWPVVTFAAFLMLRKPIFELIERIKKVHLNGFVAEAHDQSSPKKSDAPTEIPEKSESSLADLIEIDIEKGLEAKPSTDPTAVQENLVRLLANERVLRYCERIQGDIFASQIKALELLNGQTIPVIKDILRIYCYDFAVTQFPDWYKNRPFGQWLGYLKDYELVVEAEEGISISDRGREFLKWRMENGRSGPWHD